MNKIVSALLFLGLLFTPVCFGQEDLDYNYESTYSIPIELAITETFSSKNGINEGDYLHFRVKKDVIYNGQTIVNKGEMINGKVETFVTSGMNGFPAEIYIEFEIPGIKNFQIMGNYIKEGQNRCFWVYPLKWSLTLIPFVGSLTNLIKGGHVVLKPSETIIIYYYPEWGGGKCRGCQ